MQKTEFSIDTDDFDILPWPVVAVNTKGKVIYKNKFSYKLKTLRKNSSFSAILLQNQRDAFEKSLETGEPGIFECCIDYGVSHALTVRLSAEVTAIFMNICSVLLREVVNQSSIQIHLDVFSVNKRIVEGYIDICKRLNTETPHKTAEILRNNALRFSRAAHHFSVYASTLTKTVVFDHDEPCDIVSTCNELFDYFRAKISPLGYRLSFNIENTFGITSISKRPFLNVLLEFVAIALRISDSNSVMIHLNETGGKLIFRFELETSDFKSCRNVYAPEFDFISAVCKHFDWKFTPLLSENGQNCMMTFSVPVKSGKGHIHSPDVSAQDMKKIISEIADQVFSVFYFKENL